MKRPNRLVSFAIILTLIVSIMAGGFPGAIGHMFAASGTADDIVELSEPFEAYAVGAVPDGQYPEGTDIWSNIETHGTSDSAIVGLDGTNHVLEITNASQKNTIISTRNLYPYLRLGKAAISFRIRVSSKAARAMVYLQALPSKPASDAKFIEFKSGNLYVLGHTQSIGTYVPDTWYKVSIGIDVPNRSFDLSLSGDTGDTLALSNQKWTTGEVNASLRFLALAGTTDPVVQLDDLLVSRDPSTPIVTPTPEPTPTPPPAVEGNPRTTPISAYQRIEAEDFSTERGMTTETAYDSADGSAGGVDMGHVNIGDMISFRSIDFGSGAAWLDARVGCWTTCGTMTLHLDSETGPVIGKLDIRNTGGDQDWDTQSTAISGASGIHDLYITYSGIPGVISIGTLNWLQFSQTVPPEVTPPPRTIQPFRDTYSDTWVATDALGRTLPTQTEVGPPKQDKAVGIFYFPHQATHWGQQPPNDITKLEALNPLLKLIPGTNYWWSQPLFGYYLMDDEYVIRKHAQLLSDAGVDVIILDISNGLPYDPEYTQMFKTYQQIRDEGGKTPQIAFFCGVNPDVGQRDLDYLYRNLYIKGDYSELWFQWQGKPLILADTSKVSNDVKSFFTVRRSWAWSDPSGWFGNGQDAWTWLDNYPQNYGWHDSPDKPEEISVNVAQHPVSGIGRSFHDGKEPSDVTPDVTAQGLNFSEQWSRALQVDPPFVFITGWNEWTATASTVGAGGRNYLGQMLSPGDGFTVDLYNQEYSRDIEPERGGFGDDYYYQMANYIRQYKGVRALPQAQASGQKTIVPSTDFSPWQTIGPEYRDTVQDTLHRNHPGVNSFTTYVNDSGRNDIDTAKVTFDSNNVYFYVRTTDPITAPTDSDWMTLYLDTDQNHTNGWNGYDFVLNRKLRDGATGILERSTGGWNWQSVGDIPFVVQGNELQLAIPRALLGLDGPRNNFAFDFKWTDHTSTSGDIFDFTDHGDAAPNDRYNFRFQAVDDVAPVTIATLSGTKQGDWYRMPVNVSLAATDFFSGVAKTEYGLSVTQATYGSNSPTDGETTYTAPLSLSDGVYDLTYGAVDNVGNKEQQHELPLQIDSTPPTFRLMANDAVLSEGATFENDQSVALRLEASDNLSGVDEARITLDGNPYESGMAIPLADQLGSHLVSVSVTDKAGNTTTSQLTFQVTTSLRAMNQLLDRYKESGDVSGPLIAQLTEGLAQAGHQLEMGAKDRAARDLDDFRKHLNSPALDSNVSDAAKRVFGASASWLINVWSRS